MTDLDNAMQALNHSHHIQGIVSYVMIGCLGALAIGKLIKALRK